MTRFHTTRWSVVLRSRGEKAEAHSALESLCRSYRPPVLAYIRARGHAADVAEDLAQSFFEHFIEHAVATQADPARGRFRSFLLTALKHFLGDAGDRERALKRGGGVQHLPLDLVDVQDANDDAPQPTTPEQVFERSWAQAVLHAAMRRLRAETAAAGKAGLFDALCEFLIERPSEDDYAHLAETLAMRRGTVAVTVHRLRARLQDCMREELAQTTVEPAALDDEIDHVRRTLPGLLAMD